MVHYRKKLQIWKFHKLIFQQSQHDASYLISLCFRTCSFPHLKAFFFFRNIRDYVPTRIAALGRFEYARLVAERGNFQFFAKPNLILTALELILVEGNVKQKSVCWQKRKIGHWDWDQVTHKGQSFSLGKSNRLAEQGKQGGQGCQAAAGIDLWHSRRSGYPSPQKQVGSVVEHTAMSVSVRQEENIRLNLDSYRRKVL